MRAYYSKPNGANFSGKESTACTPAHLLRSFRSFIANATRFFIRTVSRLRNCLPARSSGGSTRGHLRHLRVSGVAEYGSGRPSAGRICLQSWRPSYDVRATDEDCVNVERVMRQESLHFPLLVAYVYISSRVTRRHATGPVFTVLRELVIPTQRWRPSLAYNALPARSLVMQMAVPRPPRLDIRQKQRRKA